MKTSTVALIAVGAVVTVGIGYAIYFDQKRRNDPEFRKRLKRERKRLLKVKKSEEEAFKNKAAESISQALDEIANETFPVTNQDKEKLFVEEVAKGEELAARGEEFYNEAAVSFFRALKVYPSPVELVMIYQKTVPEPVFNLVMAMMSLDVKRKQELYYKVYPPAEMNVRIDELPEGVTDDGKQIIRRGLVATRDFDEGEVIYTEIPVVSALEPALEGQDFCNFCLKQIPASESTVTCSIGCEKVVYCSTDCEKKAVAQYHQYLCTSSLSLSSKEHEFATYATKNNVKYPGMIARFLATMVYEETTKVPTGRDDEYNTWDHIERLRFLEVNPGPTEALEIKLLKELLGPKVPGIDEFVTEERYLTLKGKLQYNAYGVETVAEGEKTVPKSPEQHRNARSTSPAHPLTGAALYRATSYLAHSCEPNTAVSFPRRTQELALVATRPIKQGEELTTSYVQVDSDGEPVRGHVERKKELADAFRFKCACKRCEREEAAAASSDRD
ncbi:hypothetical protein BC936DRAFT_137470 [Jimgerdemannia flammicorona]|uniref:MAS20 protein import receptor-domain-containing protein n=2 Tax=Jimgerdemannia flammicorona TaxID=994334 RepID=A0A433QZ32_9FUNG|nr:hypothetical protein BC936DRAFT_137470 [Jimgerdemannia flammicorona]RUS34995.1 MAS20 protein import receptor-domain-containing protein [Jimgerdemannia flammicorona]